VFTGSYPTSATPVVTIGGASAEVFYCGLVGAGLYQINLSVPGSLAPGTHAVVVTQNGAQSPSTAVLRVTVN
jgi:uncharacterized protein (TIGR03437 family)